jgi:hypothetical protein
MIKSALQSSLTNDVKYRSMSAGAVPSNEYLIETVLVNSPVASVTFNNLSQWAGVYRHLQIVSTARSSFNGTGESLLIRLNGVATATYSWHRMFGTGSSVLSSATTSTNQMFISFMQSATSGAGAFGASAVDILEPFNASKNTTLRGFSGITTGENLVSINSGAFFNTAPVSSITLLSETGANFIAGCRFSLYGVN